MFTVLSFGHDRSSLLSRHKILVKRGLRVTSIDNKTDVVRLLKSRRFHILVIGHVVPMQERNDVARQAKRLQNARVIFLYKDRIAGAELADAVLTVDGTAEDLSATVLRLARGNAADTRNAV